MIPGSNNPDTLLIDGIVATIDASTTQAHTFNIIDNGSLDLTGVVPAADTISVTTADGGSPYTSSKLIVGDTPDFQGSITFNDSVVVLDGLVPSGGASVSSWGLSNGVLSFYAQGARVAHFNFTDVSPDAGNGRSIQVAQSGSDFYVTEGGRHQPDGATLLPGNLAQSQLPPTGAGVTPPTGGSVGDYHTPASSAAAAFSESVDGAPASQIGSLYSGPVSGLFYELVVLTPGNINVATHSPGCFVKTGAGNDAVALQSGTNVVDAGGGSNFLTSGTGFDTFFLDARNIPAASSAAGPVPGAIWDTIEGFGHGDATTFWGVGPGTALAWQKNEGAVGHTGLTLHANMPNGSEASLTLAGIDSKAGLQLSYGSVGGSSYLYVKAV